jgi:hypothetical protein
MCGKQVIVTECFVHSLIYWSIDCSHYECIRMQNDVMGQNCMEPLILQSVNFYFARWDQINVIYYSIAYSINHQLQDKRLWILTVQEMKKFLEEFVNHFYWFFEDMPTNMIIQLRHELMAEVLAFLSYRRYVISNYGKYCRILLNACIYIMKIKASI